MCGQSGHFRQAAALHVEKKMHDMLIGGSVVSAGTLKAYITAVGENTVLANILKLVKAAQTEKPPIQQLADRISAIFVPTVISLAILTIIGNYFIGHLPFSESWQNIVKW